MRQSFTISAARGDEVEKAWGRATSVTLLRTWQGNRLTRDDAQSALQAENVSMADWG